MPVETVPQRFEVVPIDSIEPHPENPNKGELEVIADSIERNGFYGVVIVQEATRRILAGEHRWKARKDLGAEDVPVMLVDVDDDRAKRIMAVDNRSARRGYDEDDKLAALLQSFGDDLGGTGYDDSDLTRLLRSVAEPEPPAAFPTVDEVETHFECPRCHYRWSGSTRRRIAPGAPSPDADPV